ncbi:MAG: PCP reductase family protein [Deltaproteobacteria bacterium]|nr:PCP reductase family protein [Deltaproteobacteria bacterium]
MKFLCDGCGSKMALKEAEGFDDNTVTISFVCEKCGTGFSMLANPMETQLVKGLGVQVGGRKGPHEPMEVLKGSLVTGEGGHEGELPWEKEALERLERVPLFARPMARKGIERYARENGYSTITPEVMEEARKASGM